MSEINRFHENIQVQENNRFNENYLRLQKNIKGFTKNIKVLKNNWLYVKRKVSENMTFHEKQYFSENKRFLENMNVPDMKRFHEKQ